MIEKYANEMRGGKLPFVQSDNKDEAFFLSRMKYYYGMYCTEACCVAPGGFQVNGPSRRTFKELRDHGRGAQSVEKYLDQIDPKIQKGKNRNKRRLNISHDLVKIYSKFRAIVKGKFDDLVLIPGTEAIDEFAKLERLLKKNEIKVAKLPETQMILSGTGYQADAPDGIEDASDVEYLYEIGDIRLGAEILMKDAIDVTMARNGWDDLKTMVIEDIIDFNRFSVDIVNVNGIERILYVDPASWVNRPSIMPDFRDTDFRGYTSKKLISELLIEAPHLKSRVKQLEALRRGEWFKVGRREDYAIVGNYNDFGVDVLKMYFLEHDTQRYVSGTHPRGSRIFERVGPEFTLSERAQKAGKTIEEYPILTLYECSWVIGTDIVYNYGPVDYIVQDGVEGNKEVCWPLIMYAGTDPSFTEKCIGFDDDLQTANLKLRSLISKLPPGPRMIVFQDLIADTVRIADEDYTILDILSNFQTEGVMVLRGTSEYGLPGEENPNTRRPIEFLPSGISEDIAILRTRIMDSIEMMRQATGINEVVDGTSKQQDMLKGVADSMRNAANAALSPDIKLFVSGFKAMCKYIGLKNKARVIVEKEVDFGALPISPGVIKTVKLGEEIAKYDWGIYVRLETMENRQMLIQNLMDRREMIPEDVFFSIWNSIQSGDYKKAQYVLSKASRKAKREEYERNMQIAGATANANAQAAAAAEQAKQQTLVVEFGQKKQLEEFLFKLESQKSKEDFERRITELREKSELDKQRELAVVKANNENRLNQNNFAQ